MEREAREGERMSELYHLLQTESTFCPTCGKTVSLLSRDSRYSPAFYICFDCRFVGQVGVGVVPEEQSEEEDE